MRGSSGKAALLANRRDGQQVRPNHRTRVRSTAFLGQLKAWRYPRPFSDKMGALAELKWESPRALAMLFPGQVRTPTPKARTTALIHSLVTIVVKGLPLMLRYRLLFGLPLCGLMITGMFA